MKNAQEDYLRQADVNDLLKELTRSDRQEFAYFTNDSIVVGIGVPHAIGDYMKVEVKDTNIENKLIR